MLFLSFFLTELESVRSSKCQFVVFCCCFFLPSKVVFSSDLSLRSKSLRFVLIIASDNLIPGNRTQLAILALMEHQHMP